MLSLHLQCFCKHGHAEKIKLFPVRWFSRWYWMVDQNLIVVLYVCNLINFDQVPNTASWSACKWLQTHTLVPDSVHMDNNWNQQFQIHHSIRPIDTMVHFCPLRQWFGIPQPPHLPQQHLIHWDFFWRGFADASALRVRYISQVFHQVFAGFWPS